MSLKTGFTDQIIAWIKHFCFIPEESPNTRVLGRVGAVANGNRLACKRKARESATETILGIIPTQSDLCNLRICISPSPLRERVGVRVNINKIKPVLFLKVKSQPVSFGATAVHCRWRQAATNPAWCKSKLLNFDSKEKVARSTSSATMKLDRWLSPWIFIQGTEFGLWSV